MKEKYNPKAGRVAGDGANRAVLSAFTAAAQAAVAAKMPAWTDKPRFVQCVRASRTHSAVLPATPCCSYAPTPPLPRAHTYRLTLLLAQRGEVFVDTNPGAGAVVQQRYDDVGRAIGALSFRLLGKQPPKMPGFKRGDTTATHPELLKIGSVAMVFALFAACDGSDEPKKAVKDYKLVAKTWACMYRALGRKTADGAGTILSAIVAQIRGPATGAYLALAHPAAAPAAALQAEVDDAFAGLL